MPKLETLIKEASTPILTGVLTPSLEYMSVVSLAYIDEERLKPLVELLERDEAYAKLLEKENLGLMEAKAKEILEHVKTIYETCGGGFTHIVTADEILDQLQILGADACFLWEFQEYLEAATKNKLYITPSEMKELICLYILRREFDC